MKFDTAEKSDRFGNYPAAWVSGTDANPRKIHKALWDLNGSGYKYALIIDCYPDEYVEMEKTIPVYFLDACFQEIAEYMGKDAVLRELKDMGWLVTKEE